MQKVHLRLTFVAQKRRCLNSLTLFVSSAPTRTRCPIGKRHVVGVAEVQSNDKVVIHDSYPSSLRKQQQSLLGVDHLAPVAANSIRCKDRVYACIWSSLIFQYNDKGRTLPINHTNLTWLIVFTLNFCSLFNRGSSE